MLEVSATEARRRAGVPRGVPSSEDVAAWEGALDALECHLDEIEAGLAVGSMPTPYEVAVPEAPLPVGLASRARRLLAAQGDLERRLRERLGVLATILAGAFERPSAPVPVYLDRRD